jgi:hypothetical protein
MPKLLARPIEEVRRRRGCEKRDVFIVLVVAVGGRESRAKRGDGLPAPLPR